MTITFPRATDEQWKDLSVAQHKWTADLITDDHWQHSDDGHDYALGALHLSTMMMTVDGMSPSDDEWQEFLATVGSTACDGICQSIITFLGLDDDDRWDAIMEMSS